MEVPQLLSRSFRVAVSRAAVGECHCIHATTRPISTMSLSPSTSLPLRRRPVSNAPFSTSLRRRQEPNTAAPAASNPPSPPSTPKQELKSYIESVQKVVDGYNLKTVLPSRQYESLMVAITNSEVRLDAPNAHPDSFSPLLKTLRGEVEPVLKINLGSSDLTQLVEEIGTRKPTPVQQNPSPASSPKIADSQAKETVSSQLDKVMNPRTQKVDAGVQRSTTMTLDSLYNFYQKKFRPDDNSPDPFSPLDPTKPRNSGGNDQYKSMSMRVQAQLERQDAEWATRNPQNLKPIHLRLKPSLGRTVEVAGSLDVTRAFRRMEAQCSRNRVRADLRKQKFHVRRGQLKKDLRMQRWRVLFKEGFLAECARVRRMRRQGW